MEARYRSLVSLVLVALLTGNVRGTTSICNQVVDLDAHELGCSVSTGLESITLLTNLRTLRLFDDAVPDEVFEMTSLTQLVYQANSKLPSHVGRLSNLVELTWWTNSANRPEMPSEVGLLSELTQLQLKFHEIGDKVRHISLLTKLEDLDLTNNGITELPTTIGLLSKLTTLMLPYNSDLKVLPLPTEFGLLTALRILDLTQSQDMREGIPLELFSKPLTRLKLGDCNVVEVPSSIGLLSKLTLLDLRDNRRLTVLPSQIGQLAALKELIMLNTGITVQGIPLEFLGLESLRYIDFASVPATILPRLLGPTIHAPGITLVDPADFAAQKRVAKDKRDTDLSENLLREAVNSRLALNATSAVVSEFGYKLDEGLSSIRLSISNMEAGNNSPDPLVLVALAFAVLAVLLGVAALMISMKAQRSINMEESVERVKSV